MSRADRTRDDAGAASLLVLTTVLALAAVTTAVVAVAGVLVTHRRAAAAADLTALSVAGHALEGEDAACAAGRRTAQAQGARVLACRLDEALDAEVRVAVRLPGRLARLGDLPVDARAGRRADATR